MDIEANKESALKKLASFVESGLSSYAKDRNFDLGPSDRTNISMLSPYLRHRVITEEEVIQTCLKKYPFSKIEKYIQEVLWRTYWKGWLELRPKVWQDYNNSLNENDNNHDLTMITSFNTGIKCFDAWTKELITYGYLHNHTRMWYASIWIHTLGLPWELGAKFFMHNLYDGDPASNTLSWRWVAGLQTRGKSYMASASNISKFTNNRFKPNNDQLSKIPTEFEFIEYKANSKKFTESLSVKSLQKTGLLITSEDLDITSCPGVKIPDYVYSMPYSPLESDIYSDNVKKFKELICEDACERLTSPNVELTHASTSSVLSWAKEKELDCIMTLATPTGYINDYLANIRNDLKGNSIEFVKIFRDYDMTYWNFASKGFFNFFQKAKKVL